MPKVPDILHKTMADAEAFLQRALPSATVSAAGDTLSVMSTSYNGRWRHVGKKAAVDMVYYGNEPSYEFSKLIEVLTNISLATLNKDSAEIPMEPIGSIKVEWTQQHIHVTGKYSEPDVVWAYPKWIVCDTAEEAYNNLKAIVGPFVGGEHNVTTPKSLFPLHISMSYSKPILFLDVDDGQVLSIFMHLTARNLANALPLIERITGIRIVPAEVHHGAQQAIEQASYTITEDEQGFSFDMKVSCHEWPFKQDPAAPQPAPTPAPVTQPVPAPAPTLQPQPQPTPAPLTTPAPAPQPAPAPTPVVSIDVGHLPVPHVRVKDNQLCAYYSKTLEQVGSMLHFYGTKEEAEQELKLTTVNLGSTTHYKSSKFEADWAGGKWAIQVKDMSTEAMEAEFKKWSLYEPSVEILSTPEATLAKYSGLGVERRTPVLYSSGDWYIRLGDTTCTLVCTNYIKDDLRYTKGHLPMATGELTVSDTVTVKADFPTPASWVAHKASFVVPLWVSSPDPVAKLKSLMGTEAIDFNNGVVGCDEITAQGTHIQGTLPMARSDEFQRYIGLISYPTGLIPKRYMAIDQVVEGHRVSIAIDGMQIAFDITYDADNTAAPFDVELRAEGSAPLPMTAIPRRPIQHETKGPNDIGHLDSPDILFVDDWSGTYWAYIQGQWKSIQRIPYSGYDTKYAPLFTNNVDMTVNQMINLLVELELKIGKESR